MNLPDETSRQVRIRRIVDEYREAIRQRLSPSLEEIVAKHGDLGDELRLQLLAVSSETVTLPPKSKTAPDDTMTSADVTSSANRRADRPMPGSEVGGYRLLRELGRGGMGVVYEAEHIGSGRRLAVKLLSPDLPHTEQTIARFLNEASLAAGLSHPRTTFVYEAGERDGHFFISMELMPGSTLKDVVQSEGALPVNRAVDYILDVLEGLEAAHQSGVVHRDVKPSNCFLDAEGRAKVGDFGLSKSLVVVRDLTMTGTFLGTPQFAAPEQFRHGKVDNRTDIFATAATLYYLISGKAPFEGDAASVIAQIVADDPPSLKSIKPEVPASLSRAVSRALSKDPTRRYQDAREFRNALSPYATGGTSTADLGRRVAAFFLDITLVNIVVTFFIVIYLIARFGAAGAANVGQYAAVSGVVLLLYFIVSEGLFSQSLGKMCLGLRVVDQHGEPPGVLRAVLRALIIPGLSWVVVDILQGTIDTPTWQEDGMTSVSSSANYSMILVPQFLALLRGILCLVACSSMRRVNGYRGIHEFASGTRVVRPRVAERIADLPAVPYYAGVHDKQIAPSIGGFNIGGRVGGFESYRIMTATDQQLDRPVWIHLDETEIEVSRERRHVTRTTRQRWLNEGTHENQHWQAFEAITGSPLPEVGRYAMIPWGMARHIWLQAAEELQASLDDGTLPHPLGINQACVDEHGRFQLSDQPLLEAAKTKPRFAFQSPQNAGSDEAIESNQSAMLLLSQISDHCTADDETPAEALDLQNELKEHREGASNARTVVERLRQVVDLPYRLRWDDRLGTLAIAAGLETALLSPLPLLVASILTHYRWSTMWTMTLATIAGLVSAGLLGFVMRGGPAFWLTKVEVRNRRGPASAGRCAWRNVITWLPLIMLYATIGISLGTLIRGSSTSMIELVTPAIYQTVFALAACFGAIYAVIQPRRGLQDLLSGTFLVRRASS